MSQKDAVQAVQETAILYATPTTAGEWHPNQGERELRDIGMSRQELYDLAYGVADSRVNDALEYDFGL